jgi:glycosyltransferase involved in cell wall biosynthesis
MADDSAPVSLVMTVLNEAGTLPWLFETLLAQTVLPAEVIVADGGSTDGTQAIVRGYSERLPVVLLEVPGANISEGRNAAIRVAAQDIIAVTDAGVRLDPGWLEDLVAPLLERGAGVDVVSGFFVADAQTTFERAMGATVLPALEDIDPATFLPSSRSVAFRKSAWRGAGGYPEWLDYCEDLVFDIRMKEAGCRFEFVPEARVYFRPRPDLRAFFIQYFRYARGDGKAGLFRARHAIRYLTYSLGPLLAAYGVRHIRRLPGKAALAMLLLGAMAYVRRPYVRLLPSLSSLDYAQALYALALVPAIRLTGDLAKMAGYPVGVWWRLTGTPCRVDRKSFSARS